MLKLFKSAKEFSKKSGAQFPSSLLQVTITVIKIYGNRYFIIGFEQKFKDILCSELYLNILTPTPPPQLFTDLRSCALH